MGVTVDGEFVRHAPDLFHWQRLKVGQYFSGRDVVPRVQFVQRGAGMQKLAANVRALLDVKIQRGLMVARTPQICAAKGAFAGETFSAPVSSRR